MPLFGGGKRSGAGGKDDPLDAMLAIAVAEQGLASALQMTPAGKGGLTYKPGKGGDFAAIESEVAGLLNSGQQSAGARMAFETDEYGYRWALLAEPVFESLALGLYAVSQSFRQRGAGDLLLAAVFPFVRQGREVHWIFSCKRGAFYPFVPDADGQRRDNPLEMELAEKAAEHLPMERQMEQWYPLWGAPLDAV